MLVLFYILVGVEIALLIGRFISICFCLYKLDFVCATGIFVSSAIVTVLSIFLEYNGAWITHLLLLIRYIPEVMRLRENI